MGRRARPAQATVDQPKLTQGSWVEDGGVVVEAAFADALGVGAGDQVTLNGRSFKVVGVAVPPRRRIRTCASGIRFARSPSARDPIGCVKARRRRRRTGRR